MTIRVQVRVTGIVQGVGFRPFVYRLATARHLSGWTLNDTQGVLIEVEGPRAAIDGFIAALTQEMPPLAKILRLETTLKTPHRRRDEGFHIHASEHAGDNLALLPADSHVCEDCLAEFNNPQDRRYRYPFINCTNCGPRYSLIAAMPYDRPQTTMRAFRMCASCQAEYDNPADRRYHAQPNACADCGPSVSLRDRTGVIATREAAITDTVSALARGEIVAVKSLGGFHLVVNAFDSSAVMALRRRKKRDSKPFALMAPTVEEIEKTVHVSEHERALLTAPGRPIVLMRKREARSSRVASEAIAPRNPSLGFMLPSAPLHYLLLKDPATRVLVMTSGNISGLPIAFRNQDAQDQLFGVCDLILEHDRDIHTRIDDSVMRATLHPELDAPILSYLRKARGYAPYSIPTSEITTPLVAYGAELKTTVALASDNHIHVSQHIGDLGNDETFRSHRDVERHLSALYDVAPQAAACDLHPNFRSSRLAQHDHATQYHAVQHHHAHMASCMIDNQLDGDVIGVIYDGSGYGADGTIWGGEFLVGNLRSFQRPAHLRSILLLGGDAAVREPLRCGLALLHDAYDGAFASMVLPPLMQTLDEQRRHVFSRMWTRKINAIPSSSMGRLFDGVAALLGICGVAEYEAQGPIELEGLLGRDLSMAPPYSLPYIDRNETAELDHRGLIREIIADMERGVGTDEISRRFHATVVHATVEGCTHLRARHGLDRVVLSGGVFLNEFLLVNCMRALRRASFDAYCHREIPTNDGGISVGQIAVANALISQESSRHAQATLHA